MFHFDGGPPTNLNHVPALPQHQELCQDSPSNLFEEFPRLLSAQASRSEESCEFCVSLGRAGEFLRACSSKRFAFFPSSGFLFLQTRAFGSLRVSSSRAITGGPVPLDQSRPLRFQSTSLQRSSQRFSGLTLLPSHPQRRFSQATQVEEEDPHEGQNWLRSIWQVCVEIYEWAAELVSILYEMLMVTCTIVIVASPVILWIKSVSLSSLDSFYVLLLGRTSHLSVTFARR